MSTSPWMPPPAKDLSSAKRQYVEQFGSVLVMNTYLKIALLCQSIVCLGLMALTIKAFNRPPERIFIRINELGAAEAVNYASLEYKPQETEIKDFLIDFVHRY